MAKGGLKKSWQTMLRFFRDKEYRESSWDEAVDNFNNSATGTALNSLVDKVTGSDLTPADEAMNAFNAAEAQKARDFSSHEAALQRDWSSQEAERARDWQEEMYYKYNSLSGKISQAEQAGVNPLFAVTGNAVTPISASSSAPSGASASGSAAHGGSPTSESFVNLIGQIAGLVKLKSEVNLNDSQANKNNAEAEGQKITNEQLRDMNAADIISKLSQVELNDANIELMASKVLNTDADTQVKGAQLGQIASQIANTDADTRVKAQQIGLMLSEISKNEKSLDVMEAQISEMLSTVGVNSAEVTKLSQEFKNLVQDYDSGELKRKVRQLAEPDGTESKFDNFLYKIVGLFK